MAEVLEPQALLCPITWQMLREPVINVVGNTYEKAAIETAWAAQPAGRRKRDPLTNTPLASATLVPNQAIRRQVQDFLDAHPGYTPDGWSSRQLPPLPPPEAFSDSDAAGESADMDDDDSSSEEEDDEDDADEEEEESDESSDSEMAVADAPAEEEEESSEEEDDSDDAFGSESEEPLRTTRGMQFNDLPVEFVDKTRRYLKLALIEYGSSYSVDHFCHYLDRQQDVVFTHQRHRVILFNGLIAEMDPVEGMPAPGSEEDEDEDDDDYDDSESSLSD